MFCAGDRQNNTFTCFSGVCTGCCGGCPIYLAPPSAQEAVPAPPDPWTAAGDPWLGQSAPAPPPGFDAMAMASNYELDAFNKGKASARVRVRWNVIVAEARASLAPLARRRGRQQDGVSLSQLRKLLAHGCSVPLQRGREVHAEGRLNPDTTQIITLASFSKPGINRPFVFFVPSVPGHKNNEFYCVFRIRGQQKP